MADRGIIYVATKHDRFVEEAFLSAHSVKQRFPDLPITLFTDLQNNPLCRSDRFDSVEVIDTVTGYASDWATGLLTRVKCLQLSRYDRTLHMDTDTRVLTDELLSLFDYLDACDVGMVEATTDDSYSRKHFGRPMFNAGVIIYRRNENTLSWMKTWESLSHAHFRAAGEKPLPHFSILSHIADEGVRRELLNNDQISLAEILNPESNVHGLRVRSLDYAWNHRGFKIAGKPDLRPKILHTPSLKKNTHADILDVAFDFSRDGRRDESDILYEYVADRQPRSQQQVKASWFPFRRRNASDGNREEWITPVHRRADLHQQFGQADKAMALFANIVEQKPNDPYALAGIARVAARTGRVADAVSIAEQAYALKRTSPYVAWVLGEMLIVAGRSKEAIAPLTAAAKAGSVEANYLLGQTWFALENYSEAVEAYRKVLAVRPDHAGAQNNMMPALLGCQKYDGVLTQADHILSKTAWNVPALAFKCVALAELGRRAEEKALADFENLIVGKKILAPPGYASIAQFNQTLAEALIQVPDLARDPARHATRFGLHSELNLAESQNPAIQTLNEIILETVAQRERDATPTSANLFESCRPRSYRLSSWTIILGEQGFQIPHIHATAWLSGVYYVDVPTDIGEDDETHSGWLRFGRSEERWHRAETTTVERLICPEPGLLVTFPSYFWHGTVPLRSRQRRISYAFDIVPA